ncbi:glycosyl hydrolase family 43 [Neolewinella xylanilytica]|uniref:Glycosyl hydrolase family 43 n=1 Tax=Neolewinella xylanilytica TaxID=1514080 RepID=A0A2S6I1K1_9BACT|nr:family 43 glycosylhydrolase [Neolewinella xylanilytica]PPK85044.1 glycosyl hydrolase family 43 [Neolewinella xylanilytica]
MNNFHKLLSVIPLLMLYPSCSTSVDTFSEAHDGEYAAYLFTYFTGNGPGEEAIHYAVSTDGYSFHALNGDEPILDSERISSTGGVRDPHILRSPDGESFRMVVTDMVSANGWNSNRAMVLLKSDNLIDWTSSVVNIQERFEGQDSLLRVWAPQTIYDPNEEKYMLYWSMKYGQNDADKIYYAYANEDFTDLATEPKQLLETPDGGAAIDGDIILHDGTYHLFFKTEDRGQGLKIATSDSLTGPYTVGDEFIQQTTFPVEGSGVFQLIDSEEYILMYDMYTKGEYQFTRSSDLNNFTVIDEDVRMDFHPRHGTVIPITNTELDRLLSKWGRADDLIGQAANPAIKANNIYLDTQSSTLLLPVQPGTDLTAFDPEFSDWAGLGLAPAGPQDFSDGPVSYTVAMEGQQPKTYSVAVEERNNPVLAGYYADPDALYSENTGKFYIYPTSDGFNGWSGTYFKAFSSPDLVNWTDEGVILDLEKDVEWANRNAWAPCILEAEVDGEWKYFYYFTAAQKIGVATSDSPTGPFVDSGQALVGENPAGVGGGQVIDPEVFTDPQSGKTYFYWGNGYLAAAELNDDYTSLNESTLKIMTPDATFREGVTVFFRNGTYYFLWSENDTRDPEYRVRYATAPSPMGPLMIPENNLVVELDEDQEIYGTGHNSVLRVPDTDEWYLVYHRFTYPHGIHMGRAAGFHREVAIDRLTFNADGSIVPVAPTHGGIDPVNLGK